ncbi:MAG: N-6 DNA methylase [Bacilli bacterium]|jgi:type I restriction enzyme M protein
MNTETKHHIDAARQVLVGVVPNPTSQIDQITNALIYKFMDDMDQSAIKQGGDPSFFIKDLKNYAWTRLMDARIGNQERMNIYSEALVKFSESKQLPHLFREIFKSAFLPYRSPEVLGLFLKEINYFDYSHPEELGNAYEYLLSVMGSQGDAGQFRTPRHIIDFMVDAVDPTMEDKVLDPACGTGGFLVSAYKHILEQHDGKNDSKSKEKPLTPDQRKNLMDNFEGYDIDPGMVRLAQVNMYLHQFKGPKIYNYDTLTMEERWNDKFSVILANPPFMSPKGGVSTHSKFSIQSSRSEVLFVDYIMNHLRPNGRAGIIVPEGIIFQSGTAHKQLRKNLVEDGLYAVVSLPSGVFAPYSGVKTSILLFNNELAKQSKEMLFVKVENDGFDLGATKRPINKNDLPEALDILNKWKKGKKVENPKVAYVTKTKIAESGDYNLSGDRYRIATDYTNAKWPMVKLEEVIKINFGERITKNNQRGTKYPVYGGGGESFRTDNFNRENEYVIARFAMGENCVRFVNGQFWMMDSGGTFSINKEYENKLNKDFVGSILLSRQNDIFMCARGGAQKNLNTDHFYELEIPLPPLEVQEQIVKELDGYQHIITSAKQIVSNWKPSFIVDPKWEVQNLVDVCNQITDGTHITPKYKNEGIPFLRVTDITESNESKKFLSKEEHKELIKRCKPEKGDVLYTKNGTIGIAKMIDWDYEFSIFVSLALLKPKKEVLIGKYLEHFLNSDLALAQAKAHSKAGTVTNLHLIEIKQFKIPIPSIEIQKQIVDRIESEHILVEGNKKLIEIYEQKTKEALAKLWEE